MQVRISGRIEFFSFFLLGLLFPAQERRLMLLCGAEIASFVDWISEDFWDFWGHFRRFRAVTYKVWLSGERRGVEYLKDLLS